MQQNGVVRILNLATGAVEAMPFLSLSGVKVGGEQGLLGMAFDPNYASNGRFYLNYVVPGGAFGNGVTRVSQFSVSANPNVANPASEKVLISFDHPQANHNGGWIGFSPRAGDANNLYIATGDGGAANDRGPGHIEPGGNAQSKATLLGKMLRVHVNSTTGTVSIPADNPFVGVAGARPEIWLYGLRNPFRASFDRLAGTFFIGDVGQSAREEIDVQKASNPRGGENYGWRVREGSIQNPAYPGVPTPPGAVNPIFDYPRSVGQTVIGGYVYRGQQVPRLRGTYIFADFGGPEPATAGPNTGRIFSLNYNGSAASNFQDLTPRLFPTRNGGIPLQLPSSLGEDARGELYITDLAAGNVFKIVPFLFSEVKGDFNSDRHSDILWQNNATGTRAIWFMNGTAFASAAILGSVSTDWSIVGTGDFDGDGHPDILWQNSVTGTRAIWLMNGTRLRIAVTLGSVAREWNIAGAGDFNHDGQVDILWQNSATGERGIWLMDGTMLSRGVSLGFVPIDWRIAASGDFNGDAHTDILFQNRTTGQRVIWIMNNTTRVSSAGLGTVSTDWDIAGTGDYNGDNKTDILWQNTVTGARAVWLMNGLNRIAGVYLPSVGTQWSIRNK